jgi:hypothetical protein
MYLNDLKLLLEEEDVVTGLQDDITISESLIKQLKVEIAKKFNNLKVDKNNDDQMGSFSFNAIKSISTSPIKGKFYIDALEINSGQKKNIQVYDYNKFANLQFFPFILRSRTGENFTAENSSEKFNLVFVVPAKGVDIDPDNQKKLSDLNSKNTTFKLQKRYDIIRPQDVLDLKLTDKELSEMFSTYIKTETGSPASYVNKQNQRKSYPQNESYINNKKHIFNIHKTTKRRNSMNEIISGKLSNLLFEDASATPQNAELNDNNKRAILFAQLSKDLIKTLDQFKEIGLKIQNESVINEKIKEAYDLINNTKSDVTPKITFDLSDFYNTADIKTSGTLWDDADQRNTSRDILTLMEREGFNTRNVYRNSKQGKKITREEFNKFVAKTILAAVGIDNSKQLGEAKHVDNEVLSENSVSRVAGALTFAKAATAYGGAGAAAKALGLTATASALGPISAGIATAVGVVALTTVVDKTGFFDWFDNTLISPLISKDTLKSNRTFRDKIQAIWNAKSSFTLPNLLSIVMGGDKKKTVTEANLRKLSGALFSQALNIAIYNYFIRLKKLLKSAGVEVNVERGNFLNKVMQFIPLLGVKPTSEEQDYVEAEMDIETGASGELPALKGDAKKITTSINGVAYSLFSSEGLVGTQKFGPKLIRTLNTSMLESDILTDLVKHLAAFESANESFIHTRGLSDLLKEESTSRQDLKYTFNVNELFTELKVLFNRNISNVSNIEESLINQIRIELKPKTKRGRVSKKDALEVLSKYSAIPVTRLEDLLFESMLNNLNLLLEKNSSHNKTIREVTSQSARGPEDVTLELPDEEQQETGNEASTDSNSDETLYGDSLEKEFVQSSDDPVSGEASSGSSSSESNSTKDTDGSEGSADAATGEGGPADSAQRPEMSVGEERVTQPAEDVNEWIPDEWASYIPYIPVAYYGFKAIKGLVHIRNNLPLKDFLDKVEDAEILSENVATIWAYCVCVSLEEMKDLLSSFNVSLTGEIKREKVRSVSQTLSVSLVSKIKDIHGINPSQVSTQQINNIVKADLENILLAYMRSYDKDVIEYVDKKAKSGNVMSSDKETIERRREYIKSNHVPQFFQLPVSWRSRTSNSRTLRDTPSKKNALFIQQLRKSGDTEKLLKFINDLVINAVNESKNLKLSIKFLLQESYFERNLRLINETDKTNKTVKLSVEYIKRKLKSSGLLAYNGKLKPSDPDYKYAEEFTLDAIVGFIESNFKIKVQGSTDSQARSAMANIARAAIDNRKASVGQPAIESYALQTPNQVPSNTRQNLSDVQSIMSLINNAGTNSNGVPFIEVLLLMLANQTQREGVLKTLRSAESGNTSLANTIAELIRLNPNGDLQGLTQSVNSVNRGFKKEQLEINPEDAAKISESIAGSLSGKAFDVIGLDRKKYKIVYDHFERFSFETSSEVLGLVLGKFRVNKEAEKINSDNKISEILELTQEIIEIIFNTIAWDPYTKDDANILKHPEDFNKLIDYVKNQVRDAFKEETNTRAT